MTNLQIALLLYCKVRLPQFAYKVIDIKKSVKYYEYTEVTCIGSKWHLCSVYKRKVGSSLLFNDAFEPFLIPCYCSVQFIVSLLYR